MSTKLTVTLPTWTFYTSTKTSDPLFYAPEEWREEDEAGMRQPGWYFCDETWSRSYGPFCDYQTAKTELKKYSESL